LCRGCPAASRRTVAHTEWRRIFLARHKTRQSGSETGTHRCRTRQPTAPQSEVEPESIKPEVEPRRVANSNAGNNKREKLNTFLENIKGKPAGHPDAARNSLSGSSERKRGQPQRQRHLIASNRRIANPQVPGSSPGRGASSSSTSCGRQFVFSANAVWSIVDQADISSLEPAPRVRAPSRERDADNTLADIGFRCRSAERPIARPSALKSPLLPIQLRL